MLSPVQVKDFKPGGRHQVFSHCHRRAEKLAWRQCGEVCAALGFALYPLWTGNVCCRQLIYFGSLIFAVLAVSCAG